MLKVVIFPRYGSKGNSFLFRILFSDFALGALFNLQDPFDGFFFDVEIAPISTRLIYSTVLNSLNFEFFRFFFDNFSQKYAKNFFQTRRRARFRCGKWAKILMLGVAIHAITISDDYIVDTGSHKISFLFLKDI